MPTQGSSRLVHSLTACVARWITPIFVGCDVVALLLQLVGAVMIAGTSPTDTDAKDKLKRGKDIALAGVTVQIVGFGLFSVIAARFHFTSKHFKDDLQKRLQPVPGEKMVTVPGLDRKFRPNWEVLLYAVNLSCALILVSRCLVAVLASPRRLPYSKLGNVY